jgi:hypothetical protein
MSTQTARTTQSLQTIDQIVNRMRDGARSFAKLPIDERIALDRKSVV